MSEHLRDVDRYDALNASFPIDEERRLRGRAGEAIARHVLKLMETRENRVRVLSEAAAVNRAKTVEAIVANLIVAGLNRANPNLYLAISFNRNIYTELGLSHDAMVLARDALVGQELIEHHPGVYVPHFIDFLEFRRVARLRMTIRMRDLLTDYGVGLANVTHLRQKTVKLKKADQMVGPEPDDVLASRSIIERVNARIDASALSLPEAAWHRMEERRRTKAAKKSTYLPGSNDTSATWLYRVFTRNWQQGGRLYGGWWQSIEAVERPLLTIDGEPTTEIDFGTLHPALLYHALGKRLDRDPYALPPYSRDLCKETFQRLINRGSRAGGASIKQPKKHKPPSGVPFDTFLTDYKVHLSDIAHLFGKSVGLLLQKEDSELMLAVLDELDRRRVVSLPIHDSVIVKRRHGTTLREVMHEVYSSRYGMAPTLKENG